MNRRDASQGGVLRAGVAKSDITTDAKDAAVKDRLYAKALVLDDGRTRIAIVAMDAFNRKNIEQYLGNIRAMEKLARIQDKISTLEKHKAVNDESGEASIDAEILGMRIGDCVMVSCPAELVVEVGLNVKKASPYEHTFAVGFSNGYMHYGPQAEDYDKGGYEVTECLLAPEWQEIFEAKAVEIMRRL